MKRRHATGLTPAVQTLLVAALRIRPTRGNGGSECANDHPVRKWFPHGGRLELAADGSDPFQLFHVPPNLSEVFGVPVWNVLIRERCDNVFLLSRPIDLASVHRGLTRLTRTPCLAGFAEAIRSTVEPHHYHACFRPRPPNLMEVADRLTAMGRAEGGRSFLNLGLVAGVLVSTFAEWNRPTLTPLFARIDRKP